jgi:cobalt/nickel transport system ATP-binding protein
MDNRQPIIRLSGIHFSYSTNQSILEDLDFTFYHKDRVGFIAPNGSGKTTLFHLMMGLLRPDSGAIEIFGKSMQTENDFAQIRHRIGLLFQDADDQLFCPTVLEDVAFGPLNMGKSKKEAIDISRRTLNFLGLSEFENRITFKLSGGEKKLVSLATILSMEPEILLLDEPLAGLDTKTQSIIIDVLSKMNMSYMVISHDIEFLKTTTNRICSMKHGKIFVDEAVYVHRHDHAHTLGNVPHKH